MVLDPVQHQQLLLSLDQRQDDVLERLDELDQQIEALIRVWTQQRSVGDSGGDAGVSDEDMVAPETLSDESERFAA